MSPRDLEDGVKFKMSEDRRQVTVGNRNLRRAEPQVKGAAVVLQQALQPPCPQWQSRATCAHRALKPEELIFKFHFNYDYVCDPTSQKVGRSRVQSHP